VGFLDKAKAAAEQATAKAKEGVDDVQAKRELSQAYSELGKTAYDLIESGDVTDQRLATIADKIRVLRERATTSGPGVDATVTPEHYDSTQPPAMPN
jgi:hypothetical protein